jgi:hypothetical protein
MNTLNIYNLVKRDIILYKYFRGVFSADCYILCKDGFYIVNSDQSFLPGSHWVVYYVRHGVIEFFDSLGKNSKYYGLKKARGLFNNIVLQGSMPVCGYYCIYYCLLRCRGICMKDIVNSLKRHDSDIYVMHTVLKHLDLYKVYLRLCKYKRSLAHY